MPSPSETSIANAALTLLGERRINDLDENSKTANVLKERFDEVRDALLRRHPWSFATVRDELAANTTDPTWGYDFAYSLPADLLRLLEVENPGAWPYRVEGSKIVTDIAAPLRIVYTRCVTVVNEMDVLFRQALAADLASDVAEAITGDNNKIDQLAAIVNAKIREARNTNGQEGSPRMIESSEWLDSREETGPQRNIPSGPGVPL
jgi:hypothetical protein